MRILITGVAGFIGSNLAQRLVDDGHSVVGIDNLSYGVASQIPEKVDFRKGDIRSPELSQHFSDVDVVYHLAAKNCISDCQMDPLETADINILGSVRVFDAAVKSGVKKVIYAESAALYEGTKNFPTPESECFPETMYGASKAASMYFARSFEKFSRSSTKWIALRYFNVYGPRQDYRRSVPPVMSAFILSLLRGERPVIYGKGNRRRDFVYVDDVNDFHVQILNDSRADGGVFNLGTGLSHSVLEVYSLLCRILERKIEPEFRPELPAEAEETRADISRARSLSWEPRTSLEEGLRKSIEYIRNHVL